MSNLKPQLLSLLLTTAFLGACGPSNRNAVVLDVSASDGEGSAADDQGGTVCGNGLCMGEENTLNCPEDCGSPAFVCGDGVCQATENEADCPADCSINVGDDGGSGVGDDGGAGGDPGDGGDAGGEPGDDGDAGGDPGDDGDAGGDPGDGGDATGGGDVGGDDGGTDPPGSIGKWRRKVLSFTTADYSGNPFKLEIEATFTHSASGKTLTLPGYYDGGNTWKIGFMPTKVGNWSFKTSSPNGALSGHSGTINAVASGHQGLLAKDPKHPDKWRFADGPLVVPIGVFVNAMLEDASKPKFKAMADFVANNNLQLLNFRLSENDKAFKNVGAMTMALGRWQRLEQRMEILTERGLGVDVMLYTDDSGKPSFGPKSAPEKLLIRYAVARLCGFPSVLFNSGIDLSEYRNQEWVNWYGKTVKALDPYGHPVSSRYKGGSGGQAMNGQSYNSVGDRNSKMSGIQTAYAPGDGVPASNNDNWSEDLSDNINGHTPQDIRRAAWKATVAGGVAFHVRHNTLFCPAGITECDRYFHIASLKDELDSEQWLSKIAPFLAKHLGDTFGAMQPKPSLVGNGGGKFALADPKHQRLLFLLLGKGDGWDNGDGGPIKVNLGGVSGSFKAQWFDPRSGKLTSAGIVNGGSTHSFKPPNTQDWILILKQQ